MTTVHLIIRGRVQGVFYRASAKEVAERLHIKGWIRNMDSGDVEVKATGREEDLNAFIEWCRQGPPHAHVTEVIAHYLSDEVFDQDFSIRRG